MSSSIYHRNTELRNVHTKDLYNLAVILDDENYWQTLMEVIPQKINNQTFGTKEDLEKISSGASYERKYSNDQIRLIENAIRRPGESRLCSEILFDEWGSSGRKNERPTLGVLLHLLVQSKLYRAADFVAELLNEPKPSRPTDGPAAEFEFEVDVFNDIQEAVNDSRFYPNTEDLQENVNNDINNDYYTKYHKNTKKIITTNVNAEDPPKPPPRLLKSARLLKQQQHQEILQQQQSNQLPQQTANKNNLKSQNEEYYSKHTINTLTNNENIPMLSLASSNNIPKLSALINTVDCDVKTTTMNHHSTVFCESLLPNLSALNSSSVKTEITDDGDDSLSSTPSLIYTKPNIIEFAEEQHPEQNSLPIVIFSKSLNINSKSEELKIYNADTQTQDLPAISALNVNGEKDNGGQHEYEQPVNNVENVSFVPLSFKAEQGDSFDECPANKKTGEPNLPPASLLESTSYNRNSLKHQLDAIEEDYNGIEHEHDLDDDEDSIPNLSFLENRSSNNESSLTSVTNTSGENSFDQSVNDCSSTSTDNVPFLSVLNQ